MGDHKPSLILSTNGVLIGAKRRACRACAFTALRRGGCLLIAFQQRSGCTPADDLLGHHRMNIFDAIDGNLDAMAMDQPKNTESIIICRPGPTRLISLTGARYSRNKRLRRRAKTCHFLSSLDRRKRLRLPLTTAVRERWYEAFRSSRVDD
jgi:hypothetical protein